jgi:uncharacterized protein (DUF1778 family)
MKKTIHIPIADEDKALLQRASKIERLKVASFVRRTALLKADEILKQSSREAISQTA